jgi:hypothetical protein
MIFLELPTDKILVFKQRYNVLYFDAVCTFLHDSGYLYEYGVHHMNTDSRHYARLIKIE